MKKDDVDIVNANTLSNTSHDEKETNQSITIYPYMAFKERFVKIDVVTPFHLQNTSSLLLCQILVLVLF